MNSETLINELIELTQKNLSDVQSFKSLTNNQLNLKPTPESWSILECIEHLNRYGNFYIPEISDRIKHSKFKTSPTFKTGILGNYFAKSMLPKEKLNKMKTFKSMNPINSLLDRQVLDTFIQQQESLITLLNDAKKTDLTKVKTAISISKLIKLRLGDTFRIVIYHNWRHIVQAKKMLNP